MNIKKVFIVALVLRLMYSRWQWCITKENEVEAAVKDDTRIY